MALLNIENIALLYFVVQIAGGLAAAGFAYAITPAERQDGLSATQLGPGIQPWQGYLCETWITCILVLTIFGSTNVARKQGNVNIPPLIIGLAVALCIFAAWHHTGASMNPARSLGPAVVKGIWKDHWVYWAGPLTGGALATLIYVAILDRVDIKQIADYAYDTTQHKYEMKVKGNNNMTSSPSMTSLTDGSAHHDHS